MIKNMLLKDNYGIIAQPYVADSGNANFHH